MALDMDPSSQINPDEDEHPAIEIHDNVVHEDMPPQPASPVLHPQPAPKPTPGPVTKPLPAVVKNPVASPSASQGLTTKSSSFPWWLVILVFVIADGQKKGRR